YSSLLSLSFSSSHRFFLTSHLPSLNPVRRIVLVSSSSSLILSLKKPRLITTFIQIRKKTINHGIPGAKYIRFGISPLTVHVWTVFLTTHLIDEKRNVNFRIGDQSLLEILETSNRKMYSVDNEPTYATPTKFAE
ncbi:hypothetical protein PENTCL1PPCAC_30461, partial [Pristionchus entomophagus]